MGNAVWPLLFFTSKNRLQKPAEALYLINKYNGNKNNSFQNEIDRRI